jgi:hypothetical protein
MPKSYVTSKAASGKLSSRWASFSSRKQRQEPVLPHQVVLSSEDLPPVMDSTTIRSLFHALDSHSLEHSIAEAVRHTASLKQVRDHENARTNDSAPSVQQKVEGVAHAYECWKHRLNTLEMIADARASLKSLKANENDAVTRARNALLNENL